MGIQLMLSRAGLPALEASCNQRIIARYMETLTMMMIVRGKSLKQADMPPCTI